VSPTLPLSLDWEDWFQLCCPPYDTPDALDNFEDRLELATDLALQLCADAGAKGTWFCLADQAQRHPELLRRIVSNGHRIGLHGLRHQRAFVQDRASFHQSLLNGKAIIEDISGVQVQGFRAPEWSLRDEAAEYWRDLPALGFTFDSSRAPLRILGDSSWPRRPYRLAKDLWELPPPVLGLGPLTVPLWGWAMRVLPEFILSAEIKALAAEGAGTPLVLHPWELDERQPLLPQASLGHRFAHRAGLQGYGPRLKRLWSGLRLIALESWIEAKELSEAAESALVLQEAHS
jgi:polysaccharide deacetylase family protein (PEP-CTERM system associated)